MTGPRGRRLHNSPWKRIYGLDRKYTRRVDRANERLALHVYDPERCGKECPKR